MYSDYTTKEQLEYEIRLLPKGSISYKTIKGKPQPYLQYSENGKRISRYLKAEERDTVISAVARRKELEKQLEELKSDPFFVMEPGPLYCSFETRVITGSDLYRLCQPVRDYKKRECMGILDAYLTSKTAGKICLLYGLRRTGKTTMIMQAIEDLPKEKTAYIKIMSTDSFAGLEQDMQKLSRLGFSYVFIDEVTLLKDFIDSASLFSDIYAMYGMKIVLSGTDSLGFLLSGENELYDRAYTIHTTFIPFREYAELLNIHDVDEYIRYGGTFRIGETAFDDPDLSDDSISFRDDETTRRYIDTAIAHNIQHSLMHYQNGSHFRHLLDLYDNGELTGAINRIIEDMNHSFLLSVLTKDFVSNDLGISRKNLRKEKDPAKRSDALDHINEADVVNRLKEILSIRNKEEQKTNLTNDHVREIKEYLYLLDLIADCPTETIHGETPVEHIIFTQPGMRYAQAQALVYSLLKDPDFASLDPNEREMVTERILQEVRGRMLEDMILLETSKALPRHQRAFKLQFPIGEYDMVICDEKEHTCRLYEIKHSTKTDPKQYRFLLDEDMCSAVQQRYGTIAEKSVIYRGKPKKENGIQYLNAEEYLENL